MTNKWLIAKHEFHTSYYCPRCEFELILSTYETPVKHRYNYCPNCGDRLITPSSAERSVNTLLADGWQDFTIDNLPEWGDLIAIFPAPEQCTKPYIVVCNTDLEWIEGDKWYKLPSFS